MIQDRVLTTNDCYDGPRLGVAELHGVPHIYEAAFDHGAHEDGETYFLSPVDPELLSLVLEDWAIWCRWEAAHRRNEVTLESHPALPHERARHEELKAAIGGRLRSDPDNRRCFKAKFSDGRHGEEWDGVLVEWQAQ